MQQLALNGTWRLRFGDTEAAGTVPGSVYSILLENGLMEDPYYRDNELKSLALMDNDFALTREFNADRAMVSSPRVLLRCEGLDTLCTVKLNGAVVGTSDNMHRIWEFDVTENVREGTNQLEVLLASPTRFIAEADKELHMGGSYHAMLGFPHLRKAHCMFGWDWGPRLPDAGIWRDISLLGVDTARMTDVHIRQFHSDGAVSVRTEVTCEGGADCRVTITAPDGATFSGAAGEAIAIDSPQLWWPNSLGGQPLYTVRVEAIQDGETVDTVEKRIGLRTMTVAREKDEWGESFAHRVNGVSFFAMGADYIPEDNILSRITPQRTRRLLEQCKRANYNVVRIWGGGYYPDDWFYNACDELGLVVWQDFMFACANYYLDDEERFEKNITAEFVDNIRRLRHHPSLGLWCGNNEMEMFAAQCEYNGNNVTKAHYIRMFEHIIPHVLRREDPDTFYWPASPSSGGSFDAPNDPDRGDVHYWEVWHGNKPFDDYRNYHFRYASEFGFQSFPNLRTVESFTLPEDRNIFSRVMEMHQRNDGANGKIMNYLSKTFLYPASFDTLLYASQLLQAEAIKYGVEHWRRNRGRCMGAVVWQLNDIWPVASWASIDYYGRWKALHYYEKRFFAPVMISCHETGETTNRESVILQPSHIDTKARLSVANETLAEVRGMVTWFLCNERSEVLDSGEWEVSVPAMSSRWMEELDFHTTDFLHNHLTYAFVSAGKEISGGSVLFTAPKHYCFADPELSASIEGSRITVTAKAYAKSVEIASPDCDLILSDNYFDMEAGSVTVEILEGAPGSLALRSVYDIR